MPAQESGFREKAWTCIIWGLKFEASVTAQQELQPLRKMVEKVWAGIKLSTSPDAQNQFKSGPCERPSKRNQSSYSRQNFPLFTFPGLIQGDTGIQRETITDTVNCRQQALLKITINFNMKKKPRTATNGIFV